MESMHTNKEISLIEGKVIMTEILSKVIAYFEAHNLHYSLIGGTLIGSIRHKGFIPWDDDIDLFMPKPDYDKFIQLTLKEPVADDIYVSSAQTNPNHIWPMTKAVSKKTYLVEPNVVKKYRTMQENFGGIYIDIFPAYGMPDDDKSRKLFNKKIQKYYEYFKRASRVVTLDPKQMPFIKRLIYSICFLPYRAVGAKKYLARIIEMTSLYPYESSDFIGSSMGLVSGMKDVLPKKWLEDTTYAPFENLQCKIPTQFDAVLKQYFGDYMVLPPEEERKTHPREVYYR